MKAWVTFAVAAIRGRVLTYPQVLIARRGYVTIRWLFFVRISPPRYKRYAPGVDKQCDPWRGRAPLDIWYDGGYLPRVAASIMRPATTLLPHSLTYFENTLSRQIRV